MNRKQGWLWMLAGVVLAILAGFLIYRLLTNAIESAAQAPAAETKPVVVAVVDIPMRSVLDETMVAVRQVPVELIPRDAALDLNEVVDKMALTDLAAGEIVLRSRLETPTNVSNIALTIPKGMVVMALPTTDLMSRVGMLKPGDHVDILFSLDYAQGGTDSMVTLDAMQNIEVQGIVAPSTLEAIQGAQEPVGGAPVANAQQRAILVAVKPHDALVIKYLLDAGAALDFVLRPPDDESAPFLDPVNLPYLSDLYRFEITSLEAPTPVAEQPQR